MHENQPQPLFLLYLYRGCMITDGFLLYLVKEFSGFSAWEDDALSLPRKSGKSEGIFAYYVESALDTKMHVQYEQYKSIFLYLLLLMWTDHLHPDITWVAGSFVAQQ